MQNTFAYLLEDGNAVVSTQVEDYFKRFFSDYVKSKYAEFVSVQVNDSDIYITYKPQAEDCGGCDDAGVTVGLCECEADWFETVDYKNLDVFGTI